MVTTNKLCLLGMIALIVGLTSCRSSDSKPEVPTLKPPVQSEIISRPANVEAVEILVSDSVPAQVRVMVLGALPSNCAIIDEITQIQERDTFKIEMNVLDRIGPECGGEPVPFQEFVSLDVAGLAVGAYSVDVHGHISSFTLKDQHLTDAGGAVVSGRVWHDLCAANVNDRGISLEPLPGCVEREDGRYLANGAIDPDEPGLGGLLVDLGAGTCPATGLAVTITDDDGLYLFGGIAEGQYCVSIDAKKIQNVAILESGEWTHDSSEVPSGKTITLSDGENRMGVDFGWDFVHLPLPEADSLNCNNGAKFVENVTIPDDFEVAPGEVLTKTWRLINSGSCPWTTGYGLVFLGGDKLNTREVIPITTEVAPGETVDLSARLTIPLKPGIYRGEWMLRDADGRSFGFGTQANKPIWFQIVVIG